MIDVSVIIVTYNTREMTLECLRALHAEVADLAAEVFVVDNASRDGSADAIRCAFPSVRVIENPRNSGFGAANNLAIQQARGRYLLLLNSDAFPRPGSVRLSLSYLDHHNDVACVGPRLLNGDGSLQLSCYKFPSPWRALCENLLLAAAFPSSRWFGDYRRWAHDAERDVEMVVGAFMMIRAPVLKEVGAFDESFFLYAEETDLCRRIWKAGHRIVFLPTAEVVHLGGGSGRPQAELVFQEFRGAQERFMWKHHGATGLWLYRIMNVIGAGARIPSYSILSIVRRGHSERYRRDIVLWWRIFLWTVGRRGPGLRGVVLEQK